jgi:hypothetical protein
VFDGLEEPVDAESVNKELWDCLQQARCSNPSTRTPMPFISFLKYAENLNNTEIFGTLHGVKAQVNISNKHSEMMTIALLDFMAEKKIPERMPQMWETMSDHFDTVLQCKWARNMALGREAFIASTEAALNLFVDAESRRKVEEALAAGLDPPLEALRTCMQTRIGAKIYAKYALKVQWLSFVAEADKGVAQLIYHDFDLTEVWGFKQLMAQEVEMLKRAGQTHNCRREQLVQFLGCQKLMCEINDLNDDWSNRYMAMMKSVAVSLCLVERLPWEKLCYGAVAKVHGVPEAVKIPAALLVKVNAARTAMLKLMGPDAESMTIAEMQKQANKHHEALLNVDNSWLLEASFLQREVVPIVTKNLHDEILDLFPVGVPVSFVEIRGVAERIHEIKRSPASLALPTSWNSGLTSLAAMVNNLNAGLGPNEKDIKQFDSFRLQVVKRCELWCTHEIKEKDEGVSKRGADRVLVGKKAIDYIYNDMMETHGKNGAMETDKLKIYRKFCWLLSQEQRVVTDKWIKISIAHKPKIGNLQAVTDGVGEPSGAAASSGGASASSAASPRCLQIAKTQVASWTAPHATPTKDGAKHDNKSKSEKNSMMKLFGSKAIIK